MANSIIFSSLAQFEIQEAYSWYEEKQDGLGDKFVDIIEQSVEVISNIPESFPIKVVLYRQYPLPKFPFVIIYEFLPAEKLIYILHIFNTHKDPQKKSHSLFQRTD